MANNGIHLRPAAVRDLCIRVTTGGTPSRRRIEYFDEGRIPWVKTQELTDRVLHETTEHITEEALADSSAKLLPAGTVLVAMYGATAGHLGILGRPMTCNQACCALVVDGTKTDARFLYYALLAERPRLKSLANGAAQQNLSVGVVANLQLAMPPLREQRAIAEVLGALDDKIECNTLIAGLLERRLAELFTALNFDELKGDLVRLDELVELNPVRAKPRATVAPYIDMAALPTESALVAVPNTRPPKSGARFINGDTVMARITPCLENGKTAYIDCLVKGEAGIGSTEFIVLRPRNDLPAKFAYFLARSPRFRDFAVRHMSGSSGRQRCPADALARYEICRPTSDALAKFAEQADPAFARMRTGLDESLVLAQLRDTLLPRLLSGEMRVRNAEAAVEEVA